MGYLSIQVTFSIPHWFPQNRFDYIHYRNNGWDITYGNKAEDKIFDRFFPEICEISKFSHVIFNYPGHPSKLEKWICKKEGELDKYFNKFKEAHL